MKSTSAIPYHRNIVELYRFLGLSDHAVQQSFHVDTHQSLQTQLPNAVQPFRNDFYEVSLVTGGSPITFQINQKVFTTAPPYLVFTCPQQVRRWEGIQGDLEGYVLFFNLSFLSQTSTQQWLEKFPFFNIFESNLLPVGPGAVKDFLRHYEAITENHQSGQAFAQELVQTNLQSILWLSNRHYRQQVGEQSTPIPEDQHPLVARFRHLVNVHFIEKRTVNEYADLLFVSANHLSQTIKQTLGVNAKSLIEKRLLIEVDYLLQYTPLSIREISFKLRFSEASHFTRFFKKHHQMTPTAYREALLQKDK